MVIKSIQYNWYYTTEKGEWYQYREVGKDDVKLLWQERR
jgi:hypothetical protein